MNKQIVQALRTLGVPAHLEGYGYLKSALEICLNDTSAIRGVTKAIYPIIANANDTTPTGVERAIRHAIEVAWARGDKVALSQYFGNTIKESRGKPTNAEFLATVAESLRMEVSV